MATLVLALAGATEDRLLAEAIEHGHSVAARLSTAREVVAAINRRHADAVAAAAAAAAAADATAGRGHDACSTGSQQQRQQEPQQQPPQRQGDAQLDAVLVAATRTTLSAELLDVCDRRGIRLIAMAASAAERQHAAVLGLLEVLDITADWSEIEAALGAGVAVPARLALDDATTPARRASTVIAVWGPAGAPGRTTLAVNIAAEIAACGHTVVVADADSYGGTVAPILGMLDESPGFAAACRLSATESLSRRELERIAQRYNSPQGAFWVLTGIGRAARWPELGADKVQSTLEACREWVEYVVVDTGFCLENDEEISSDLFAPRRNAATLAVLRAADHVVAVGLADPVGMSRFLRSWAELADLVSTTRLSVVMNRVRASAVGIDPQGQVRQTLLRFGGISQLTVIPHDLNGFDTAVLDGRTLRDAAPRSAARLAVQRLVREELVPVPADAQRRGKPWPAGWRSRRAAATMRSSASAEATGQAGAVLPAR